MITESSNKIPDIQGLILIDCWEPQVYSHFFKDKFYINLIEKIGNKNFKYIVNNVTRLQIDLSDPIMANTIKVCQYRDDHPLVRNLLQQSGDEKTSVLVTRYLIKRAPAINISNTADFTWFAKDYLSNKIQNWLVVGHTWQMCTHSHVLGLPQLAQITKDHGLNFYATDYSFCTMTEQPAVLADFEQDSLDWRLIKDFGYQLLSQ
jgi:hypothetical protein